MGEDRGEVADWLVGILGDDDSVAPSSQSWPAVTVSWRQSFVLFPPQHLEMEWSLCESQVEFKHAAWF